MPSDRSQPPVSQFDLIELTKAPVLKRGALALDLASRAIYQLETMDSRLRRLEALAARYEAL